MNGGIETRAAKRLRLMVHTTLLPKEIWALNISSFLERKEWVTVAGINKEINNAMEDFLPPWPSPLNVRNGSDFIAFSLDEEWMAVGGQNGTIRIYSRRTGYKNTVLVGSHVKFVHFSPCNPNLILSNSMHRCALWDLSTNPTTQQIINIPNGSRLHFALNAEFSLDGMYIAVRSHDLNTDYYFCSVWSVEHRTCVWSWRIPSAYCTPVSFRQSDNGSYRLAIPRSYGRAIRIWDLDLASRTGPYNSISDSGPAFKDITLQGPEDINWIKGCNLKGRDIAYRISGRYECPRKPKLQFWSNDGSAYSNLDELLCELEVQSSAACAIANGILFDWKDNKIDIWNLEDSTRVVEGIVETTNKITSLRVLPKTKILVTMEISGFIRFFPFNRLGLPKAKIVATPTSCHLLG